MFDKILIANRGEIALRVVRAAREMGIATVAVHSTADADAMHVRMADEAICIGPPPSAQSYLSFPAIMSACEITGSQAIHPGYGFLSENAAFVQAVEDHGLTFIGPSAEHIRIMGDKITAKETAKRLGMPWCRARTAASPTLPRRARSRTSIGYPVIVKATAGGGGRGMKVAKDEAGPGARVPDRPVRGEGRLRQRRGLYREVPRRRRAISRSRSSATARAARSIWASATVRCSAATRRCWRRRPARSSPPRSAPGSARSAPKRWPRSAIAAPAPSSSSTRTASSTSSR